MINSIALNQLSIRELGQWLARCSVIIGLVLMSFSIYLMNKVLVVGAILALLSIDWRTYWQLIKQHRTALIAVALFVLFLVGITYSLGSWHHTMRGLDKYTKLLFLPVFMPLFQDEKSRVAAMLSFVVGVTVSVLAVWLGFVKYPFVNAIDHSFLIAISAFICLRWMFVTRGVLRLLAASAFIFGCSYLLMISVQRTGYIALAGLITVFVWQQWRWRGLLAGAVLLVGLFVSLNHFSPRFQGRIQLAVKEIKIYPQRIEKKKRSIGMRLAFAEHSWDAIKRHPVVGNGTGSFFDVYPTTGGPLLYGRGFSHPHNEYILIAFQLGFVGLIVFLAWFIAILRESSRLPIFEKQLVQGLVVAFMLLGLCNASLFVNPAGDAFIVLLAVMFSASLRDSRASVGEMACDHLSPGGRGRAEGAGEGVEKVFSFSPSSPRCFPSSPRKRGPRI